MKKRVAWWSMCGFEFHRQSTQTAQTGSFECRTAAQQIAIQVQANVFLFFTNGFELESV